MSLAARVCIGFQRRLADVRAVERFEREMAVTAHVEEQRQALAAMTFPMKVFPRVEEFIALFDGRPRHRRPILVIVGGSNLGKSLLAGKIMERIATKLGVEGFLEITVEGSDFLDFTEYDHRIHCGVILDGIGDAMLLHANREILQGRPKKGKSGKSATMVYANDFTLCNRAVIATMDLSAANLDAFHWDHWLSNERNVLHLPLTEKAYVEPMAASSTASAAPPASPPHPATKRRLPASPACPPLPALAPALL